LYDVDNCPDHKADERQVKSRDASKPLNKTEEKMVGKADLNFRPFHAQEEGHNESREKTQPEALHFPTPPTGKVVCINGKNQTFLTALL
jgi:hypothetical protein